MHFRVESENLYPTQFAGYTMLRGMPLSDTKVELIDDPYFAKTLAVWLKELHSTPVLPEHTMIKGDQSGDIIPSQNWKELKKEFCNTNLIS